MAEKIVSTQITDHVDGQPAIVLSSGNWGQFDPKTNSYKDTGIKASPEDDATAIKYYKLGNTSTPPEAPTRAGGWDSLTTLNASLAQAGWDEDPLTTSKTNKFCWIAFYGKENVVDTQATESAGHLIFKPKYTRTKVSLWSNYADSPTIAVVGNEIQITNPDGTVITQKFATTEAITDIANLIASLQEQMDGSVYSYSLEGEPSMTKVPVTTWIDGVDPSLIADIYSQHVGDTYTDLLTYISYRFALISGSASDPMNYGWKVIEDSALTNALGEIARLGREKVTIFTETPTAYSKGDMWLQPDNTMKIAIASRETFSEADWLQPYATKSEVSDIREDLTTAQTDATAAKNQIGELVLGLTTMDGEVAEAIKDNIISDTEHMNLTAELKQLNVDQESLNATVAYLLASTYLPTTPKNALVAKKELLLGANGTSGSMGAYRTAISTMIADRVITAPERTAYNNAFSTYKTHLKDFNAAISNARQAIDAELKRLSDEKVDGLEIGGRNLLEESKINLPNATINGNEYWEIFAILSDKDNTINIEGVFQVNTQYSFQFEGIVGTHFNRVVVSYQDGSSQSKEFADGILDSITTEKNKTVKSIFIDTGSLGALGYIKKRTIKLERGIKATDWSPAPEDIQSQINDTIAKVDVEYALGDSLTVAPTTGWNTVAPVWQPKKFMWQRMVTTPKVGTAKISNTTCIQGAQGKGISKIEEQYYHSTSATALAGGTWSTTVPTPTAEKYIWTRSVVYYDDDPEEGFPTKAVMASGFKGEDGAKGEGAISVSITRRGSFRTYWRQIGDQGQILTQPEAVSEIIGGVEISGVKYVQCKVVIYKGSVDVTASALADPTTQGKWYINDEPTPKGTGEVLNIPVTYADGKDDEVRFEYIDTNAKNWVGQ